MKKILLLLTSILLFATQAFADPVNAFRAGEVAKAFFQNDPYAVRRMAPLHLVDLYRDPMTRVGDVVTPAFHVFNRDGGGFVIIAGDDACKPVLAYSFENAFGTGDSMPEGVRVWLSDFEDQVAQLRSDGVRSPKAAAAWTSVMDPTRAGNGFLPAVKLETPIWNQTPPFNNLTPVRNGKNCAIGCVPLAMGMIMRFFGYPAKGEGLLPTYSYDKDGVSYTILGLGLGEPYDWDRILYDYTGDYTDEQAAAVASLVYHCAVAAQARFAEETPANFSLMARSAVEYFGYDPGAYLYARGFADDATWLEKLKVELQDHPVLYSAGREGGAHAFVVDGYDEQGLVSVNWGWGGRSNGYYALSAFAPSSSRQYPYNHKAFLGLVPKQGTGGSTREYLYFEGGTGSSGTVYGGLTPSEEIMPGKDFTMRAGYLYNGGIFPFEGQFYIALTDSDGVVKERISSIKTIEPLKPGSGRGYSKIDCLMHSYPMDGDRIRLIYRSSNWSEGVWKTPEYMSDVTAEIVLSDKIGLPEVTSLSYDKTSGDVTVETKDLVDWSLKNASGTALNEGVVYDVTTLTIPTRNLPKGSYTLTLKRGGSDQCILTLKMGNK